MKRDHRVPVLLSEHELEQVQEYRWRHRIRSQQEATRQLIAEGLRVANEKADAGATASAK